MYTVWKFKPFPVSQILHEFNTYLGIWKAANFVEFLQFEIYQSQIVEMAFFLEIIQNKIHVL